MKYWLMTAAAVGLPIAAMQTPMPQPQSAPEAPQADSAQEDLPTVPLAFTKNQGQLADDALFAAVGGTMQAFFTKDSMVFRLFDEGAGANLFMNFEGTEGARDIVATSPLGARSNYLFGKDAGAWVTDVPMFAGLEYQRLYEGVNLAVHNERGAFEYDFLLEPGIGAEQIALSFNGADSVDLDASGDLVVSTAAGQLRQAAPVSWQIAEDGQHIGVESRFVKKSDGSIGFEIGSLDDALATVIDPQIVWATYLGGSSCERVQGIAMDEDLFVYGVGMTFSSDIPTTPGAFDVTDNTRDEGVAFKLSPDGSTLLWCTYFGGADQDHPEGLALAGGQLDQTTSSLVERSLVIVGRTSSDDFPVTAGTFQPWKGAGADAFVLRLGPNGDALDWSTYWGDRDTDGALAVDTNNLDEVLVVGETQSVGFATAGAFQTVKGSHKEAFVTKIAADGSAVLWSSFLGGSDHDWAIGCDFDDVTDEVVVCGSTLSSDFPTTVGAFSGTYGGAGDAWAARITADGSSVLFSTLLPGTGIDVAKDVEADGNGRTYVVGYTDSADFPTTPGSFQPVYGGNRDGFIAALEPGGASLVYSSFYGGNRFDEIRAFDIDFLGVAFITGTTESDDLPMAGAPIVASKVGWSDVFLAQVERDGLFLEFSSYVGAGDIAEGESIAQDFATGAIVAGGRTRSGFPVTAGAYDTLYNFGSGDMFIVRLKPDPCDIQATTQTLGVACGATLTSTPPRMGKLITVTVSGGSPNAPVIIYRSGNGAVQNPLQIEGCDVYIDWSLWSYYILSTDANGTAQGSLLVPNDSARCGLEFILQGIVIDLSSGPLSFGQMTNALIETMGS
ncbi:MAG: hypothetical protein P1V81_13075 [Planctomycetota bacterium]|nr:hypothetical protein [Planctomycetota bacterium]